MDSPLRKSSPSDMSIASAVSVLAESVRAARRRLGVELPHSLKADVWVEIESESAAWASRIFYNGSLIGKIESAHSPDDLVQKTLTFAESQATKQLIDPHRARPSFDNRPLALMSTPEVQL